MEADTRGDPESPLRWLAKSVRQLAGALAHRVHFATVAKLLRQLGYSLQANRKTREGATHPDRDAQFEHIDATAKAAPSAGEPVISVDTKKKGAGQGFQERRPRGRPKRQPELVRTHDYKDKQLGTAIPYGVYDVANNNEGWVSVGIDHDTAQFARST